MHFGGGREAGERGSGWDEWRRINIRVVRVGEGDLGCG